MNITQLAVLKKRSIARKGLKPGKMRPPRWGQWKGDDRREFMIIIPAEPDHLLAVTGTAHFFSEEEVTDTREHWHEI